jgi:hypothetical protein
MRRLVNSSWGAKYKNHELIDSKGEEYHDSYKNTRGFMDGL